MITEPSTYATVALPPDSAEQLHARESSGRTQALFVLNSLAIGGSETKVVRVANGLVGREITAGIAYLKAPHALRDLIQPQVPVKHLDRRGKFSFAALRRLRSLIQGCCPEVILSVNLYPTLYMSLATMGLQKIPRRIALLNTTTLSESDRWRLSFYKPFLQRLDAIVYGCELQRTLWRPLLDGRENSSVIYNGVDVDRFVPIDNEAERQALRAGFGISPSAFVIGTVGRLAPEKNQKVLIETLARMRKQAVDAHLLIVGEGQLRSNLEQRVAARGLQANVTFVGMLRDVRPALASMDVFVLPSTHIETFSNAALEAMSMAKPVVLSRIGGATEMVADGEQGFTIEVSDLSRELPAVLERLHADPQLRAGLGHAARGRVIHQFSIQTMIDSYVSLIEAHSHSKAR